MESLYSAHALKLVIAGTCLFNQMTQHKMFMKCSGRHSVWQIFCLHTRHLCKISNMDSYIRNWNTFFLSKLMQCFYNLYFTTFFPYHVIEYNVCTCSVVIMNSSSFFFYQSWFILLMEYIITTYKFNEFWLDKTFFLCQIFFIHI